MLEAAAGKFGLDLQFTGIDWANCDYYLQHGAMMPADWFEQLEGFVSCPGTERAIALASEKGRQDVLKDVFIVDDQDGHGLDSVCG